MSHWASLLWDFCLGRSATLGHYKHLLWGGVLGLAPTTEASFALAQCGPTRAGAGRTPAKGGGGPTAGQLAERLRRLDAATYSTPTTSPKPRPVVFAGIIASYLMLCVTQLLSLGALLLFWVWRLSMAPLLALFYLSGSLLSLLWRLLSLDWLFVQSGRVGFYLFFKHASASGVPLWIYTSGATSTILAFPLFFFYTLPDRFTRYFFGLSWGRGPLKSLIGLTGFVVYLYGA